MTEPFLSRWSKRKQGAKAVEPQPPLEASPPAETVAEHNPPEEPPPDLPAIESLDAGSDYSVFMKPNVPTNLRQQALARLWASDPSLMAPETLDLHMGDYTSPAVAEVVKTAWRLGKGVLDAAELAAEKEEDEEAAKAAALPQPPIA